MSQRAIERMACKLTIELHNRAMLSESVTLEAVVAVLSDALQPPCLADYDLMVGQNVKFMRAGRKNRQDGVVKGINDDGSVLVFDCATKYQRSIMPDEIEAERKGPRGGKVFVKVEVPS